MLKSPKIAIIGGGVAGSSSAIYLSSLGLNVTLFEKNSSLVDGPPMCHLHSGGNLYREISDEQCVRLLKESIEFLRFYPHSIDFRPTILSVPLTDENKPETFIKRFELLKDEYQKLINQDIDNKVLGEVDEYFKAYYKDDLIALQDKENPNSHDKWMTPFCQNVNLDKLKYPVFLVQEYGINVFRVASSATLLLQKNDFAKLHLNTKVTKVKKDIDRFIITYKNNQTTKHEEFDMVINSSGYLSGVLDDSLNLQRDRFLEFKAAYLTKWQSDTLWPEVIFLGKRGSKNGMGQFTPYNGGYFQLHGMTKDITLYNNGLVKNPPKSSQPKLPSEFIEKIEKGWKKDEIKQRTHNAIKHISKFIPNFAKANKYFKPLYGAQQIPGDDDTLRAAEISFVSDNYARCEIVKASSVFSMSKEVVDKLIKLGYLNNDIYQKWDFKNIYLDNNKVDKLAMKIAEKRGYPKDLGLRVVA